MKEEKKDVKEEFKVGIKQENGEEEKNVRNPTATAFPSPASPSSFLSLELLSLTTVAQETAAAAAVPDGST